MDRVSIPDGEYLAMLKRDKRQATRIANMRAEIAGLRHDLERCMARELALLNPTPNDAGAKP